MFHKAYICLPIESRVNSETNRFSVDGGKSVPISEGTACYKVAAGPHTLVVTSGNGRSWTVETTIPKRAVLLLKLDIWNGDIDNVLYRFDDPPFGISLVAKRLPEE